MTVWFFFSWCLDHHGDCTEVDESNSSFSIWWTRSAETPLRYCSTNSERPSGRNNYLKADNNYTECESPGHQVNVQKKQTHNNL